MGIIPVCAPVLSISLVLCKVAVSQEFGQKQYKMVMTISLVAVDRAVTATFALAQSAA